MPLKLQAGLAYLLPAATSFTLPRPLPRLLLPVLRFNPPTNLGVRQPHEWPKVTIMKIVNTDRDANSPTASAPAGVVEIPKQLAQRCRYRGEMMMIDGRVCAIFADPDFVCRYGQAVL